MDDLKPCPFCGGEAEIWTPRIVLGDDDTDVDYMAPCCTGCGISGDKVRFRDHNRQSPDFLRAKAEAIAAWNTHAPDPRLAEVEAERDGLRAALGRIASHQTKCVMPWTHEIAADTYSADLDRLRNIARQALGDDR